MKANPPRLLTFPVPAWLCATIGIVLWIAGSLSEDISTANRKKAEDQDRGSKVRLQINSLAQSAAASTNVSDPTANPSEGAAGLATAAAQPAGLGRLEAFNRALEGINASNWQETAEAADRAQKQGLLSQTEEEWIYQRIGEVAGAAAIKFFEPEDMGGRFRRGGLSTMRGWATKDQAGAWAYIENLPESPFRSIQVGGFIRAALEQDYTLARAALESMTPQDQAGYFQRELAGNAWATNSQFAEDWLKRATSDDEANVRGIQGAVFGRLVQLRLAREADGGDDITGWLSGFAGKSYSLTAGVQFALRNQSMKDPARAISLLEALIPRDQPVWHPTSWNVIAESVAMLVASNPDAGMKWITDHRDTPKYGPAVYALIAEQGASMTEDVIQNWMQTVDEQTRKRISELREKQKSAGSGQDVSLSGRVRRGGFAPQLWNTR